MCGIAGFFYPDRIAAAVNVDLRSMTKAIARRGPDDEGAWLDDAAGLALGHRRLSIVDLSPAGHQPMSSRSGRYVVVFNGEIYNHLELRQDLGGGRRWRGGSDTETLLEAVETWGLASTLTRCTGMFALALWDRETRELTLARDRFGEKPLYYGWASGRFVFSSDLSAVLALPGSPPDIDWDAARSYFLHNSVPAPASIYKGVYKLSPGCLIAITRDDARYASPHRQKVWWSAQAVAQGTPFTGNAQEAVDELDRLVRRAVDLQMVADVPVGAFLSGGVDSSLVCALMQETSTRPVRTFSIGFEDPQFDESAHARAVASHLGTEHTELRVTSAMAAELAPTLGSIWSEPFADSSQIPTAILCQLAAGQVTVSLSGDGGDELFNGYGRYQTVLDLERIPGRSAIAFALSILPLEPTAALLRLVPHGSARRIRSDHLVRLREVLSASGPMERYAQYLYQPEWYERYLSSGWNGAEPIPAREAPHGDLLNAYGLADMLDYLPNDILTKVDRAAMATSLETRIPLLDRDVADFALTLPSALKRVDGAFKSTLRSVLYRRVPRELIDRPKKGFGIPLGKWLRDDLRAWAEPLILQTDELFDQGRIAALWAEHLTGARDWSFILWRVVMFRAWRTAQAHMAGFGDGFAPIRRRI